MKKYFYGLYFKCQSDTQTLAVIPALHISPDKRSCSIQLITDGGVLSADLPYDMFRCKRSEHRIEIGNNHFDKSGIILSLTTPELEACGSVAFGPITPIKYDIMGPFRYVPFMECRHSVISMKHTVNGSLCINGIEYRFDNAAGYIEGDRGRSFPEKYAWTQCSFEDGSLMLSTAVIPLGGLRFTGIISVVYLHGRQYRLATYLGARAVKTQNGEIVVRQGDMTLSAKLIEKNSHPLAAPARGAMSRTIHESASCRAAYRFTKGSRVLLELETDKASFEYEYDV